MEYLPGSNDDESTYYYEIENEFIMIVCNNIRYEDIKISNEYDIHTYDLEITKGDIIYVKYFNHKKDMFKNIYLMGYKRDDTYIPINNETILSKGFIRVNTMFFNDITKQIQRDNKIYKIIRNHE